jgi:TetR/AcrR family transcriptional regulator, transcriptional repressor for nem operon
MTEAIKRRSDTTRQRLIAAASRQFAHRPDSAVSRNETVAGAELTGRAMYFRVPCRL